MKIKYRDDMFAKSSDVSELKNLMRSLSRNIEQLTTEVELIKQDIEELRNKIDLIQAGKIKGKK